MLNLIQKTKLLICKDDKLLVCFYHKGFYAFLCLLITTSLIFNLVDNTKVDSSWKWCTWWYNQHFALKLVEETLDSLLIIYYEHISSFCYKMLIFSCPNDSMAEPIWASKICVFLWLSEWRPKELMVVREHDWVSNDSANITAASQVNLVWLLCI